LNSRYQTGLPDDLAALLDAKAAFEGATWLAVYKFALWLGLVAIEDKGGLRKAAIVFGELPSGVGVWTRVRPLKVPREARDLVDMAKREGIPWQTAQRMALQAGFATIEARGGFNETKRQVEALRRSVVTQALGLRIRSPEQVRGA